ncbi:MAG TPA: hypothetical protein VME66_06790 [Candidatus Acidoferrales bacterium]|nr:hypothetical protein [Candidatus Acidoferrales bacterium]
MNDAERSAAQAAKLRYLNDTGPGIRRKRRGKAFVYTSPHGEVIRDAAELARIRALAIPPAYTDVWIAPYPNAHLQATGRDARGRKQYRYHPRWREVRDESKFDRMTSFARALPALRERVQRDLGLPGLPREKAIAVVVRLLEMTLMRVGNEEYARTNDSYGLTTLRSDHVDVHGAVVRFRFRGKSGKEHAIAVSDRKLARVIQRMQDLPGQELFSYADDDGTVQSIDSSDVNAYLREATGGEFSAKDFRTWFGTLSCLVALGLSRPVKTARDRKRIVQSALEVTAAVLGNTPTICRKSYVHPALLERYLDTGKLPASLSRPCAKEAAKGTGIAALELALARFLGGRHGDRPSTEQLLRASVRRATARKAT